MMKSMIIGCLLAIASAMEIKHFGDNLIEYDDSSIQSISLPYPYTDSKKRVMNEDNEVFYTDGYERIFVPAASTQVEVSKPGLISSAVSCVFNIASSVIVFIFSHIPALIFGTFIALGICKLTPLCSWSSLLEVKREIRSLATPESLNAATNFLQKALTKFNAMQNNGN